MQRNQRGQLSLVLIVIIAIGLVFMGLVMNWSRLAQFKTQCQVATTTAAASTVSRFASYGESQMQQYLEGKREKCDQNGILGILIMIILIVVIIIVTIFTCGAGGAAGAGILATAMAGISGTFIVAMTIALVLQVAILVLQVTYIQPTITKMWNKMQSNIKTTEDSFLEASVSMAMQAAVTDSETIPDLLDYDMNGRWNVPGVAGSDPKERVSRYTYFYTERLKSVKPPVSNGGFEKFQAELKQFMIDLGLSPGTTCSPVNNNRCNPKCYYQTPVGGVDQNQLCEGLIAPNNTKPFMEFPLSYDALTAVTNDGTVVSTPATVVELLGTERGVYVDQTAGTVPASTTPVQITSDLPVWSEERGPLFHFLWNLKSAVDINYAAVNPADRAVMGIFVRQRVGLKYFYEPEVALDCPPCDPNSETPCANPPGLPATGMNMWRPGDHLYCNSNMTAGVVSAPHSANCFGCANDLASCVCQPAISTKWKQDLLDADVNNLREFRSLVDLAGVFTLPYDQAVLLQQDPSIQDQFNKIMGATGTMQTLAKDMAKLQDVLTTSNITSDFTIHGAGTIDTGGSGEPELTLAAADAKVFLDNVATAMDNAFGCTKAVDAAACQAAGGRVNYLKLLFDGSWNSLLGAPSGTVTTESPPILSNYIIYGWQGADANGHRGYRHVIKAEAALPKRCAWWTAEAGGLNNSCGAIKFPWVKTEKRGMFKRCYVLRGSTGCVKVRVSRWDEDQLSQAISFVNGSPLWKILSGNPSYAGLAAPTGLENCFGKDRVDIAGTLFDIPNAFMINTDVDYLNKYGGACQTAVDSALSRSVVTQVCAKYYLEGNFYKMKFIPCESSCLTAAEIGAQN